MSGAPGAAAARAPIFYGWVVVAGAFVVLFLAFGSAYAFTTFFESLAREFQASRGRVSLVFSIAGFIYFSLGAASGALADRLGPRWIIAAGMVVTGTGLFLAGRAQTLEGVYAAYGLGVGIGVGLAYVPAVGAVQRWFIRRRGLASGLAVAGIGVGTLAVPALAAFLIDWGGWRYAYQVLGVLVLVGGVGAAMAVEGRPERRGLRPEGEPPLDGQGAGDGAAAAGGARLSEALRARPFWVLYASSFMVSLGLFIPFVHLVPYALDRGLGQATGVMLLGLIGVGSTVGRFLLAGVADRFGRRRSLAVLFAGMALMMAWWLVAQSRVELVVFAFIFGSCYGGFVALAPALTVDFFGGRNAGAIIGVLYTCVGFGTLAGPTLAGVAFDLWGSYRLPIGAGAAAALAGALLITFLEEPEAWRRRAGVSD